MTVDEAASYLRVKKSTLQEKVRKGEIPYTPVGEGGKVIVFVRRILDLWLALMTRGSKSEEIRRLLLLREAAHSAGRGPLTEEERRLIARSREDIRSGRVEKLAD